VTWAIDASVCHKYGPQLGLVGRWWSGQQPRVLAGMDGLLLVVVIGDGKRVVPVDFVMRRPDPPGPGAPGRDKLRWARTMLAERLAAFRHRGLAWPPPLIPGDSWFGDSQLMQHVHQQPQGTLLVEGKPTYRFPLADGRPVQGHDLSEGKWRWRDHPWEPRVR
jgi:hypothetical protein